MAREGTIAVVPDTLVTVRLSGASSRIRDGDARFEASMDRMDRCLARWTDGEGYDDLLAGEAEVRGNVSPAAFVSTGSARLWAGAGRRAAPVAPPRPSRVE